MDKGKLTKRIVVHESPSWSSSFSRAMGTAGRAASTAAIQQASAKGTQISYLENGVVVRCTPDTVGHK